MQRLVNEKEANQINERFHDNALFQTCLNVWPERQNEIATVVARAEDIFCEAAWLMDELIDAEDDTDSERLARRLWGEAVTHIAQWNNGISRPDRYLILSTVFRIVTTSLNLHWHTRYCDTLSDALLSTIEEKQISPKDLYEHQEYERQQRELFEAIIPCSALLNDWVNEYIDNADFWLTEEIDMVLNPPQNIKPAKPESRKADKKTFDPDTFRETFTYCPEGMEKEERSIRLKSAFNNMRGTLIKNDTHYDTFEALLSGKPLDVKIVWVGTNSQLRMLFNQLVIKQKLLRKPTGGINQILSARFKKKDGSSFSSDEIKNAGTDGDMRVVFEVVEFLTPKTVEAEDLESQLRRLHTDEQERADLRGKKDNKYLERLPQGTNVNSTPNQHTHVDKNKN